MKLEIENIKTDVLCVGGGIAGLMAAIRARDLGADVIIAEKGVTRFSGSARIGNDHFWCYIPEYHGNDINAFIKECMLTQLGNMLSNLSYPIIRTWLENSHEIVKLWDSWGIPMKKDGKYDFSGHSFPGRIMTHLKYKGRMQKPILTDQALKRGVKIMDRVMVFELLGDKQGITGALGMDTRQGRLIKFQTKTAILGTGAVIRLYPGVTPALMGNNIRPFTSTGDGRAMAYRIGAELFNVELFSRHAGVKNFCRSGQATWSGVCRDPDGKPIGKYIEKPNIKYSDMIIEVDKQIFERYHEAGKGPIYMDCRGLSESDYAYLREALLNEGNIALIEHFKEEGIDLMKNQIDFSTYEFRYLGRIAMNEHTETSIPGLYTAGDESTFSISGAAVFGWLSGEQATRYIKNIDFRSGEKDSDNIEKQKLMISSMKSESYGYDWKDANLALQHTLADYAGAIKSEATLTAGLSHLRRLRKKLDNSLRARNPWELIRCLEVRNLYDLGEITFIAALERKESRGMFKRSDYPYTDPLLNGKVLIIKNSEGKPITEWREMGG